MGVISSPLLLFFGNTNVPTAGTIALTFTALVATTGPTFMLHAFAKPYIFSLYKKAPTPDQKSPVFRAENMDFFTRTKSTEFALADVKPLPKSVRPFVTFEANGRYYFVHGEKFQVRRRFWFLEKFSCTSLSL